MIDTSNLLLHTKWLQGNMVLWATRQEKRVHVSDWKPLLFTWHQSSFYGTMLESDEQQNVYLNAGDAFLLFNRYPDFFIAKHNWDTESLETVQEANEIFRLMKKERVIPDFEAWKDGVWSWKADGQRIETAWINEALASLPESGSEVVPASFRGDLVKGISRPVISALKNLNEEEWLIKIGWRKDPKPFSIIFELNEPLEGVDKDEWMIHAFLQEKGEGIRVPYKGKSTLYPDDWKSYKEAVEQEIDLASKLISWLKIGSKKEIKEEISEKEAWDFLTGKSDLLRQIGISVTLPEWWQTVQDMQPKVKAKIKTKPQTSGTAPSFLGLNAIMQFDWRLSTGDEELSEEEFRRLVDGSRRLVRRNGQWYRVDPEWMKQVRSLIKNVDRSGIQLKDVLEQHLLNMETNPADDVFDMDADGPMLDIEWDDPLNLWMDQLSEVKTIPVEPKAENLHGTLRDYQITGSSWMYFLRRYGLGACLADDMGLGKTVQTIDYFLKVKEKGEQEGTFLLICPTSVIGNWQKELEHFSPLLKVGLHYGANRKKGEEFHEWYKQFDVVITSYTTSQLDHNEIGEVLWEAIVLDEAQNIKNSYTKQSRSIRKLNGRHKIGLTGTPVENRLLELWAIFDFLNPGYLGSEPSFQKKFVLPVEKENDNERLSQLKKLVQPFLLRRTKMDPAVQLNLPEKQEIKEYCPLTKDQASLYERLVQDTFEQLEKVTGIQRRGLLLAMLGKLKQICDHPYLYTKNDKLTKAEDQSAKFSKMIELLDAILEKDEKCLIFTQFIFMGDMIKRYVEKKFGKPVLFLHGSLTKQKRDEMIDSFQNGENAVFVLSLKAGGTGLNLTEANHVIHYDRWWNPAVENQATDRAHRIGQKKFVTVHKMITLGTLEEKIDMMLESKKELSEKVIQSENWITELSTDELKDLFTLRKEWVET
ncbi:DEAD/DEAH box helicase [Fictibacillus barbaricus]|uniref:SNF2 family DNA or RNA helicase n=1 Tax=Fictibacillus barbaricus TaxID=182136 RepID=A0ABU1TVQ5_9BACL|nr:DEAD/DEAH box helicase [Fictibacillus barbaricus]MDR7071285.1 SNF2 family DNA or RNA helicase [Fictibacillus barbaricus]